MENNKADKIINKLAYELVDAVGCPVEWYKKFCNEDVNTCAMREFGKPENCWILWAESQI